MLSDFQMDINSSIIKDYLLHEINFAKTVINLTLHATNAQLESFLS